MEKFPKNFNKPKNLSKIIIFWFFQKIVMNLEIYFQKKWRYF